jgi:hypothetical protein
MSRIVSCDYCNRDLTDEGEDDHARLWCAGDKWDFCSCACLGAWLGSTAIGGRRI